jgi:hypothetical protein
MKAWGTGIEELKRLSAEFEKELTSLGLDYEQLKVDLAALSKRVGVLDAHRLPVDIHGDASFYLIGGFSSRGEIGLTQDGRPVGARVYSSSGSTSQVLKPVGVDQDSTIYHELTLKLTSNNEMGTKWHGDVVIGDMLGSGASGTAVAGTAFPSQSRPAIGSPFSPAVENVYVQDLAVDLDSSFCGQQLSAELGRTGYKIDPYLYRRPNPLPYFDNDRWGDGKWYFDGGILGFHWHGTRLDLFAGKQNEQTTTAGMNYQSMAVGAIGHPFTPGSGPRPVGLNNVAAGNAMPVESQLGGHLAVPIGKGAEIGASYLRFGGESAGNSIADRADTYGATLKYSLDSFKLNAGYSASDLYNGGNNLTPTNNYAWHASLGWDSDRYGVEAGYKQIFPQFGAPGDWGRIGIWWNPTDIQGPWLGARIRLGDQLQFRASGEWDSGTGTNFSLYNGANSSGLTDQDHLYDYRAELGYHLTSSLELSAGIEYVDWNLANRMNLPGSSPFESWYNFGVGYNLSDRARLTLLYQYSAYDGKGYGNGQFTPFPGILGNSSDKLAGSLISTQLTVKF